MRTVRSSRGLARVLLTLALLAGLAFTATPADAAPAPSAPVPAPTFVANRSAVVPGQPVTFTFRQTKGLNSRPTPTGTVDLSTDAGHLATIVLGSTGSATYTTGRINLGPWVVSASYSGDATYPATETPLTATVTVEQGATTTTLASTKAVVATGKTARFSSRAYRSTGYTNSSLAGSTRFTATAPGRSTVTEEVTTNASGIATWTPSLPDGTWSVTSEFLGNFTWLPSTSPATSQLVGVETGPDGLSNLGETDVSGGFNGTLTLVQSVIPRRTGLVDQVTLWFYSPSNTLFDAEIFAADGSGLPTGPRLGGAANVTAVDGPTAYDLTTPAPITSGTSYALVITRVQGGGMYAATTDTYADGQYSESQNDGATWNGYGGFYDLYFALHLA